MKELSDYQTFVRQAAAHRLVPVSAVLTADLDTPITLYQKVVGAELGFLLESAVNGDTVGRYSFIGAQPLAVLTAYAGHTVLRYADGTQVAHDGTPQACLQACLAELNAAPLAVDMPFSGGAVGYFAYDWTAVLERVRGYQLPATQELVKLLFCRYILIMDHLHHTVQAVYWADMRGKEAAVAYQEACVALEQLVERLKQPLLPEETGDCPAALAIKPPDGAVYEQKVRAAQAAIAAGEAFQIVLSQPFRVATAEDSFSLYRRLRRLNPSPYMFHLQFGAQQVVGASPELLVKVTAGRVTTCPIAGTRPRGRDTAADEALAAKLAADAKECAEHAMLVDLGRNDIGRISIPGTVVVEKYRQVQRFSHVMHLVSLVSGELAPRYHALDALAACFPAGTVSGAPKARAMEIIQELEGDLRGAYAGAVGYLDFNGNMDTCITIRTMLLEGGTATVRSGAGIVYDSDPAREYQEVLHKARVLFQVLEGETA